eukprot:3100209-Amphidinium_carterae.1
MSLVPNQEIVLKAALAQEEVIRLPLSMPPARCPKGVSPRPVALAQEHDCISHKTVHHDWFQYTIANFVKSVFQNSSKDCGNIGHSDMDSHLNLLADTCFDGECVVTLVRPVGFCQGDKSFETLPSKSKHLRPYRVCLRYVGKYCCKH